MSIGEELTQERRRRRRAGDPRLSEADRVALRQLTGQLADELQAALDGDSATDPLLGGSGGDDA